MAGARRGPTTLNPGSGLFLATALLCGWALLYPVPYSLCIALLGAGALTALALPRLSGGRFPLQAKNGYLGASGQATLYLSMILLVRALTDIDMIDWTGPLLLAGAGGLGFVLLGMAAYPSGIGSWGRRAITGLALSFLLAGGAFGLGASIEANMLLDGSAPTMHRLQVTGKWVARGRSTRRHLQLAAPNDLGTDDIHVSEWVYAHAQAGRFVCVQSRDGALGFLYYSVETCPETPTP
jgi:hypothetical protein